MLNIQKINSHISIALIDLKAFSQDYKIVNKREKERLGTQFILTQLLKTTNFELCYTPQNKPFLKNTSQHISISHSHDKLVIILNSKENTGIDIELIRDKIINIQHKFLNEKEIALAQNNPTKLITMWAAKEAMYKAYGLKELDFKHHLFILSINDSFIYGKIHKADLVKNYRLVAKQMDDYMMVYVLDELEEKI